MIKEVTYYDIICDRCGKSLINESETCYPDKDSALMVAEQVAVLIFAKLTALKYVLQLASRN